MIALKRERQMLRRGEVVEQQSELSYYVSSLSVAETTPLQMAAHIREHWAACESSSHHRRDRTLGEDASLIAGRQAAHAMATLRNLTLGLFELHTRAGKADAAHLPSWRRKMTPSRALKLLTRAI
jgi:predicted transposase YbfD/YdcC